MGDWNCFPLPLPPSASPRLDDAPLTLRPSPTQAVILLFFFALKDLYLMFREEGDGWDPSKTLTSIDEDDGFGSAKPSMQRSERNTMRIFASLPRGKVDEVFEMADRPGTAGTTATTSARNSSAGTTIKRDRVVDLFAGVPTMLRRRGSLDLRGDVEVPFNYMPDPIAMERENFASKPVVAAKIIHELKKYGDDLAAFDEMNLDEMDLSEMSDMDDVSIAETTMSRGASSKRLGRKVGASVYGAPVKGLPAGLLRHDSSSSQETATGLSDNEGVPMAGPLSGALAAAIDGPAPPSQARSAWQDTSALAMSDDAEVLPPAATPDDEPMADDLYAEPPVGDVNDLPPDEFAEVANALREGSRAAAPGAGSSPDDSDPDSEADEDSDKAVTQF